MKITFLFSLFFLGLLARDAMQTPTLLSGKVTDETGAPLVGATLQALQNGMPVKGAITDIDGRYRLELLPGVYDLECSYTGFSTRSIKNVVITAGQPAVADVTMQSTAVLDEVVIARPQPETPQYEDRSLGQTVTSEQIRNLPTRSVAATKAATAGSTEAKKSARKQKMPTSTTAAAPAATGAINIKGARSDGTNYYIDGIRVAGSRPAPMPDPSDDRAKEGARGSATALPRDSVPNDFSDETYNRILENPFRSAGADPVSTFSIDVDGASYANVRRFLNDGQLPPADAVRLEEMINYFDYAYTAPTGRHPFEVTTELGACPWKPEHRLLLVGLQGQAIDIGQLPPSNLVFLIDVSGSMNQADKLPLVIESLAALTDQLRAHDRVAIVVYAGAAGLVLPGTPGSDKPAIKAALERLQAGGSTAGAEGIRLAYETARKNFVTGGNNRVVLCTDGDFNVGVSSEQELIALIEEQRKSGVYLTVLGFGTGNYQDGKMQSLANKGNGNHAYIDQLSEAKKVLVNEFGGTLFTIAKDVKLQLHFNPAHVGAYRLLGYENRMLATEDFHDDAKDAGELGAGHRVTALYEIIPAGLPGTVTADVKPPVTLVVNPHPDHDVVAVHPDDLLVLQLRYKKPQGAAPSQLLEYRHAAGGPAGPSSDNFQLAAAVAEFGLLLRDSKYKGAASFGQAIALAREAAKNDTHGYRRELIALLEKAEKLAGARPVVKK